MLRLSTLIVNTPEKFAKLKAGAFDGQYYFIRVTSRATPDVWLQPQHFWNSTAHSLTFIEEKGRALIQLFPHEGHGRAIVYIWGGEKSLAGVPENYGLYTVQYGPYAEVMPENVDSILTWTNATQLTVNAEVAASLMKRSDELSGLKGLRGFNVHMDYNTYKTLHVAEMIENLPNLQTILFSCKEMGPEHKADFVKRNKVPAEWTVSSVGREITYRKSIF